MKLKYKTYTVHAGVKRHILTPVKNYDNIAAGHDNKGYEIILANGSGYEMLNEILLLAGKLNENELIYLPTNFGISEYKENFDIADAFEFYEGIYFSNYCTLQSTPKNIAKLKNIKVYEQKIVERKVKDPKRFVDQWKTNRRLTIKKYKKDMFISTNRDGFENMSNGARRMTQYGDDTEYNFDSPHYHYDWEENTSKSIGITMMYHHNE